MIKKALLTILTILFILIALFFFRSEIYHISSTVKLSVEKKAAVLNAAASALETSDVPVGALLVYNDTIMSSGYNTVMRDTNVAGHAEINAINNAIGNIGFKAFSGLDRKKLVLITSFEPCMMCKGAISEFNIKNILFLKGKGLWHWLKSDAKELWNEFNKKKCDGDDAQDSLFMLHPGFPGKNKN